MKPSYRTERTALLLLASLSLAHVLANWFWLSSNTTILGWDRPAHLARTLEYYHLLDPFTLDGLFGALTHQEFYPPLFHIASAGVYSVLGVSADAAALTNSLFLIVLLLSVYGIGRQMYGVATGLLAACLFSLFPIVFFMSRTTYIDYALMSLVAFAVLCLVKSSGFRSRGWTYALGIVVGTGLLAKWILLLFVGPPAFYVLLTSPVFQDFRDIVKHVRPKWHRVGLSVILGAAAAGLWYVASGTWDGKPVFGLPLAIVYWVLAAGLIYILGLPPRPFNNLMAAALLAACIAVIWYIPNSDFITTALYKAYYFGSNKETVSSASTTGMAEGWLYYVRGTVNEQLSAPLALAMLVLGAAWLGRKWREKRARLFSDNAWILGLWFLVPFAIFASFRNSSSWSMRFTISILPPVAIGLAGACCSIRTGWIRRAVVLVVVVIAVGQSLVLSLNATAWLPDRLSVQVPGWGRLGWFAHGEFVQWADYGPTDHRYTVVTEMFDRIGRDHDFERYGPARVGVLVNQPYLNGYHTAYAAGAGYPTVEPVDLFRDRGRARVYPQIFNMDYVIVSDSGIRTMQDGDQSTRLVTAILTDPPDAFASAFRELEAFQLPNDDVIHVFKNQTYGTPDFIPPELIPSSMGTVVNLNFGNRLLLIDYLVDRSDRPVQDGTLDITLNWLALDEMAEDYVMTIKLLNGAYHVWGRQEGRPAWNSYSTHDWEKGETVSDIREIPILPGTPPGSYQIELVVYGVHEEKELDPGDDSAGMLGAIEVGRPSHPLAEPLDIAHTMDLDLGQQFRLLGYNMDSGFRPGDSVHLTLFWQALREIGTDYTVFSHLVDSAGKVWAQKDNPPVAGFYDTSSWQTGEVVRDQYDIPIPPDIPPGSYDLQIGMYLPDTGQRLAVTAPDQRTADDKITVAGLLIAP